MWPCLGLFAITCLVAMLVAVLVWLLLRGCRSGHSRQPSAPPATPHKGVHTVTNLSSFLQQHPDAIVLFHASWCSHCKKLLPTFQEVADGVSHTLGTMECDDAEGVIKQQKLRGFPTILRFRQGQRVEEYRGNRSLADLQQFCAKK